MILSVLIKFSKETFCLRCSELLVVKGNINRKIMKTLPPTRVIKIKTIITSSADQDVVRLAPSHTADVNFDC